MASKDDKEICQYKALSRVYSIIKYRFENTSKLVPEVDPSDPCEAITKILEEEDLDVNYSIPYTSAIDRHSPTLIGNTILHFVHNISKSPLDSEEDRFKICYSPTNFGSQNIMRSSPLHLVIERIAESDEDICNELYDWKMNVDDLLQQHLKHNVSVNPTNRWGLSHFHVACVRDYFELVNFFLDSGVSVNASVDKSSLIFSGYSPLHIATRFSNIVTVRILLIYGANINRRDAYGRTPLALGVLRHQKLIQSHWIEQRKVERAREVVRILIQAHIDTCLNPALYKLHLACATGRKKARGKFSKRLINVKSDKALGHTALHYAAHFDEKIFKFLVQNGGNLLVANANGITPLDICIMKYGARVFNLFSGSLKKLIRFEDNRAWDMLSISDSHVKLKSYVSKVDGNIADWRVKNNSAIWQGFTLLHVAVILAREGRMSLEHIDNIETDLIDYKLRNFNESDESWLQNISALMVHGLDFTEQDANRRSPLHLAFRLGKNSVVESMLKIGTFVANPVDDTGLSHFHIACIQGDADAVSAFVLNGIPVNEPIKHDYNSTNVSNVGTIVHRKGSTPLHIVVAQRRKDLIGLLLSHGSDVFAEDEDGLTPIHLAFRFHKKSFDQETQDLIDSVFVACNVQSNSIDIMNPDHDSLNDQALHSDTPSTIFDQAAYKLCIVEALTRDQVSSESENWTLAEATNPGNCRVHADVMGCLHLVLMLASHNYGEKYPFLSVLMKNWIKTAPLEEFELTKLHIAAGFQHDHPRLVDIMNARGNDFLLQFSPPSEPNTSVRIKPSNKNKRWELRNVAHCLSHP